MTITATSSPTTTHRRRKIFPGLLPWLESEYFIRIDPASAHAEVDNCLLCEGSMRVDRAHVTIRHEGMEFGLVCPSCMARPFKWWRRKLTDLTEENLKEAINIYLKNDVGAMNGFAMEDIGIYAQSASDFNVMLLHGIEVDEVSMEEYANENDIILKLVEPATPPLEGGEA